MTRRPLALAPLLLLAWSAPALAVLPTVASPEAAPAAPGMLQAAGGMLLVLGLIFLCAWLVRRFGLQRLGASRVVQVVASAPVGTRERVVVVEVAGTWLVLGVTPGQVNALHSIPAPPTTAASDRRAEAPASLVALLSSRLPAAAAAAAAARTMQAR